MLNKNILLVSLFLILFSFPVCAKINDFDVLLINSNSWQDVYSGTLYANLINKPVYFLLDEKQATSLAMTLTSDLKNVLIIESQNPMVGNGFVKTLNNRDFNVKKIVEENIQIYLNDETNFNSLIVVDAGYPSNSVSVAPYALLTNSWVLFSNNNNLNSISNYVNSKNPDKILIYGNNAEVIKNSLQSSNVKIISTGNRFKDNMALIDEFLKQKITTQVTLTDGSILEESIFQNNFPIVLMGKNVIPPGLEVFLGERENLVSFVALGPEIIDLASSLKKSLNANYKRDIMFVAKVAQTSRTGDSQTGFDSLYMYSLPMPSLKIIVENVYYNKLTRNLEVVFANQGDLDTYYSPTVTLNVNGKSVVLEYEEDYSLLKKDRKETLQFSVDLNEEDTISGVVSGVYGDSPNSYEYNFNYNFNLLEFISIEDKSDILIESITYKKIDDVFIIGVKNNASVVAYVDLSLENILITGVPLNFSANRIFKLESGERINVPIYATLSDYDITNNPLVHYVARYGQRDVALIKTKEGDLELEISNVKIILAITSSTLIFLLLLLLIFRRKKYKCYECGTIHKGFKKPSHCKHCSSRDFK